MGVQNTAVYPEIKDRLEIPEDEPIFIVRAKDKASLKMLNFYISEASKVGASDEFIMGLYEVIDLFAFWQQENGDAMKIPD